MASGQHRVYATGLRNPVGMALAPESGALWVAVNERDELGHDLVPDYMTAVREGGFYGWPYSYFGPHVDTRVSPPRPDLVATALVPDYALGAHTASLGLAASATSSSWPPPFGAGMFVGQHGSWNRTPHTPRSGYKVMSWDCAEPGLPLLWRALPLLGNPRCEARYGTPWFHGTVLADLANVMHSNARPGHDRDC